MSNTYTEKELQDYFNNPESRRRSNQSPNRPSEAVLKKRAWYIVGSLAGVIAFIALASGIYILALLGSLPSFEQLENPEVDLATVVYTSDGKLLTRFAHEDRTPIPLDSVSTHVINALVATEDYRFYEHWGIDPFRIVSAVIKTLLGDRQGGSTITQQLARNLYDEIGRDVSVTRKIKEWLTAVQIERNYTKREILEMYLNTVTFGYNTYGIATAAQTYFNKPAADLSLEESALLVGMLKGTTLYNPRRNPERALARRNVVLTQMVRYGNLPPVEADSAAAKPLELDFNPITHVNNLAPYFAEHVRLQMQEWAKSNGREIDLYTAGLVVYTTLDSRLQKLAEASVEYNLDNLQNVVDINWSNGRNQLRSYDNYAAYQAVKDNGGYEPWDLYWSRNRSFESDMIRETPQYRQLTQSGMSAREAVSALREDGAFMDSLHTAKTRLEVGFVAVDPITRHVKAWVGGRDYATDKYDHVSIARRQPGSTFKPFLYTAAVDNGFSPYQTFLDDSIHIEINGSDPWEPKNAGGKFSKSMMTIRRGLATSTNTIAAQVVDALGGGGPVANYAQLMGIQSPLEPVHSLALGTSDVTLYEMTNAYATLASGGLYGPPVVITRIEDRGGNVLEQFSSDQREVLSESTAYTITDMMRGVIDSGTAVRIRSQFGITSDVAGKTGTTQESADGWFMLMHPQLVMGAWVGFNDQRVTFRTTFWGQGGHNALFVVAEFFKAVENDPEVSLPDIQFAAPENYVVPLPILEASEDDVLFKEGSREKGRVGW